MVAINKYRQDKNYIYFDVKLKKSVTDHPCHVSHCMLIFLSRFNFACID